MLSPEDRTSGLNRREWVRSVGLAGGVALLQPAVHATTVDRNGSFRYCLNTSTIHGDVLGLPRSIEIAARAGYQGIEIWIRDIDAYLQAGHTLSDLARLLRDAGLTVENAIGFAPCLSPDPKQRANGLAQLGREMEQLAAIGCRRIAAPPAGIAKGTPLNLLAMGAAYRDALVLGRKTGVMPQLEFWGASGTLFHLGQALQVAAAANDADARILADVYHLFRGGSGFEGLKLLGSRTIELFHLNDYPADPSREEQKDSDRVFPGDGVAPLRAILSDLAATGGEKVLSLELFNAEYWKRDPLEVAKTGLRKMQDIAARLGSS